MKVSIGFSCWLLTLAILKDILVAGLPLSFSNRPTRFKYWVSFDSISILGQLKSTTNYRPLIGPQTWIWEFMGLLGTLSQHLQFLQYFFHLCWGFLKPFFSSPSTNWCYIASYLLLLPLIPSRAMRMAGTTLGTGEKARSCWHRSTEVAFQVHSTFKKDHYSEAVPAICLLSLRNKIFNSWTVASVSLLNLSYDSLLNMFLSERMFDGVLEPLGFSRKSVGAICCTSGIRLRDTGYPEARGVIL